jgi:hypothetical protein
MVTVCELQIEAKKKGIKGYSGLKKAQLEELVKTGKRTEGKKKQTKKEVEKPMKLLLHKEVDSDTLYKGKSYVYLKRKYEKVSALANGNNATKAEMQRAKSKLKPIKEAMDLAKKRQYGKKK